MLEQNPQTAVVSGQVFLEELLKYRVLEGMEHIVKLVQQVLNCPQIVLDKNDQIHALFGGRIELVHHLENSAEVFHLEGLELHHDIVGKTEQLVLLHVVEGGHSIQLDH